MRWVADVGGAGSGFHSGLGEILHGPYMGKNSNLHEDVNEMGAWASRNERRRMKKFLFHEATGISGPAAE